jgi:nitroimidazol reductase NimA-like FMN-containing flavoprotein (pyridoxamine 5'-phosphate oxidase superfamily)
MIGDWIEKVEYPQQPAMTEQELVSFFKEVQFARLGTFNEDGTIHIAPIFFKFDVVRDMMDAY